MEQPVRQSEMLPLPDDNDEMLPRLQTATGNRPGLNQYGSVGTQSTGALARPSRGINSAKPLG